MSTTDPVINARVQNFRLQCMTQGTTYCRHIDQLMSSHPRLTREQLVNNLATRLEESLSNPQQRPQNPQQASLLSMIPVIGPLIGSIGSLLPGVGDFFSGLMRAFGNMIKGKGFDLGQAQQEVQTETLNDNTIAFLQQNGFVAAGMFETERELIINELSNPPAARPVGFPGAASGGIVPSPGTTPGGARPPAARAPGT